MQIFKPILMKLSKRERVAIGAAICFIGIFVVFSLAVFPFLDQKERLERSLAADMTSLEEMRTLKAEYEALKKRANVSKVRFERRSKGFTLFSFLDRLAGEVGIKENIAYMKPSSTVQKEGAYKVSLVEMKLTGVTMEQMTQYLYKIETSRNMVSIKRISLTKPDDTQQRLNAVLQVQTLEV
jgi:general secretion pathway protein M